MRTSSVLAVVGAAAALAGVLAWRHHARAPGAEAASAEVSPESVHEEVASLRAEVSDLRRRQQVRFDGLSAGAAIAATSIASAGSPRDETREQLVERAQKEYARVAEALTRHLASEPVDPVWSGETLSAIQGEFKAKLPSAEVEEARCGGTLCRVVVKDTDPNLRNQMGDTILRDPPFNAGTYLRYEGTGQDARITLFVIREGQDYQKLAAL